MQQEQHDLEALLHNSEPEQALTQGKHSTDTDILQNAPSSTAIKADGEHSGEELYREVLHEDDIDEAVGGLDDAEGDIWAFVLVVEEGDDIDDVREDGVVGGCLLGVVRR